MEVIDCRYPLIQRANEQPWHFLHGYIEFLNEALNLRISPSKFHGDIHLSAAERTMPSPVEALIGRDIPYWLIVAGGKYDTSIKWWDRRRYQAVVDAFQGRIVFIQVGTLHDFHPPLTGALDWRGKSTLRETILLMHRAQGVVCPVTFFMHLSAAVETGPDSPASRACVVIAGGRESPHWETYPGHRFIHTIGALPCCEASGCWRHRTAALGDGDDRDKAEALCLAIVNSLPKCMDMITAPLVAGHIRAYLEHPLRRTLTTREVKSLEPFLRKDRLREQLTRTNDAQAAGYHRLKGRGIYGRKRQKIHESG